MGSEGGTREEVEPQNPIRNGMPWTYPERRFAVASVRGAEGEPQSHRREALTKTSKEGLSYNPCPNLFRFYCPAPSVARSAGAEQE